jgi:uncharacterized protein
MLRDALLKFTRESSARLTVRSVSSASLRVNDQSHTESIALTPEEILGNWPATAIPDLAAENFAEIFATSPEVVLLGTGSRIVFPPRELTFAFARRGVGFEVMDTAAAARTFNVLATEGRRVVAVLYLP